MDIKDALNYASNHDLDLVEVAPNAKPVVCRVMDFGKYKYQQSKKVQKSKKHQKIIHVKEVKIRPGTEEHDYQFKLRHAQRFLTAGDKAKITVIFRGREFSHTHIGKKVLDRFAEDLSEIGVVEQQPKIEGRNMTMIVIPK